MWDLPGPGLESVSPALAGGPLTTVPSGKPLSPHDFKYHLLCEQFSILYQQPYFITRQHYFTLKGGSQESQMQAQMPTPELIHSH